MTEFQGFLQTTCVICLGTGLPLPVFWMMLSHPVVLEPPSFLITPLHYRLSLDMDHFMKDLLPQSY